MSVNEKMTAIADAIREKTGKTDKLNLDAMALGVHEAYESGQKAEYDRFWDAFQANGTRTDYQHAFRSGWTNDIFNPKYPLRPTNATSMFAATTITKHIDVDTSACTEFVNMFSGANGPTSIGTIDTRSATTLNQTFAYMGGLKTIEKLILKDDGSQTFSEFCFGWDGALANIVIEGTIGNTLSFKGCYALSKASATSIINALSSSTSGKTLSLQSTVKARFTSAEWDALVATKPNWTISILS